jgi:prepilin-type N-terminal cleavage/methylation domain-containing protein
MRRNANHKAIGQGAWQAGMTLIETMVAMAISSILIIGSITIYAQARSSFRTAENIARLQENLRFAADTLEEDIRLAGFWGRTNSAAAITLGPAVIINCADNNVTNWALREPLVTAADDVYDLPCPAGLAARENSDVLVVRHASPNQQTVATAGRVQAQTSGSGGQFFSDGNLPDAVDPDKRQLYDVVVNAYYVSDSSRYDATMPSLRRRSLVGTTMQDQEIITGVENLQVQFGVDRNGDGNVDSYVDTDNPAVNPVANPDDIISVRLWMLVRGDADETGQGYVDTTEYLTPDADGIVITPDAGTAYPQSHRRYEVTKTILLKNRLRDTG